MRKFYEDRIQALTTELDGLKKLHAELSESLEPLKTDWILIDSEGKSVPLGGSAFCEIRGPLGLKEPHYSHVKSCLPGYFKLCTEVDCKPEKIIQLVKATCLINSMGHRAPPAARSALEELKAISLKVKNLYDTKILKMGPLDAKIEALKIERQTCINQLTLFLKSSELPVAAEARQTSINQLSLCLNSSELPAAAEAFSGNEQTMRIIAQQQQQIAELQRMLASLMSRGTESNVGAAHAFMGTDSKHEDSTGPGLH